MMPSTSEPTFLDSLSKRLQAQDVKMPDGFMTTERLAHTLNEFCKLYSVTPEQLIGRSRQHHLVELRQLCFWLCYTRLRLTHALIGRIFNRHHSTVIHGIDRINTLMASEPVLRDHVNGLELWVNVATPVQLQSVHPQQQEPKPEAHGPT